MSRNTGPTAAVRQQVIERDHGLCARCRYQGSQIHHRRPRGKGGTSDPMINNPSNLVWVCARCHLAIELHRERGYADGWLLKHTRELPSEVPLTALDGSQFFLTEEGEAVPIDLRRSQIDRRSTGEAGAGHVRGAPPAAPNNESEKP